MLKRASPAAAITSPVPMVARGPKRGRKRLAAVAPLMMPMEKGTKANPLLRAE